MRTRSSQALPDFPHPTGFVLVAAANPGERHHQVVLVPSVGRAVEQLVCAVERVEAAGVARVGAVDDAVLQSERAQTRHLRGERLLVEVVPGAIRSVVDDSRHLALRRAGGHVGERDADLLLGLGERAVGDHQVAVADPHGGGRGRGSQWLAAQQHAAGAHLFGERGERREPPRSPGCTRPASYATITAWTLSRSPSLSRMCPMYVFTVLSPRNSVPAISAFERPRAINLKTWVSRSVSRSSLCPEAFAGRRRVANSSTSRRVMLGASSASPRR